MCVCVCVCGGQKVAGPSPPGFQAASEHMFVPVICGPCSRSHTRPLPADSAAARRANRVKSGEAAAAEPQSFNPPRAIGDIEEAPQRLRVLTSSIQSEAIAPSTCWHLCTFLHHWWQGTLMCELHVHQNQQTFLLFFTVPRPK